MNKHNRRIRERGRDDDLSTGNNGDRSIIIDHIYQVAVDPAHFETLLDLWEEKIAPHRRKSENREATPLFADIEIETHAARAGIVLDRVDSRTRADILDPIVSAIDPTAAFILDTSFSLAATNAAATKVFGAKSANPLSTLRLDPAHIDELEKRATAIAREGHGNSALIRSGSGENQNAVVFRMRKLNLPNLEGDFILAVSSELVWPEALGPTMQEAFGLTPAETEIVKALTEGTSIKKIAEMRCRSQATVKTQLQHALSKTDTHTQSEIVRLTLGLMDVVTATETSAKPGPSNRSNIPSLEPKEFITLKRPGDRQADHLVLGDQYGRPLLLLHFDFGLTRLPAAAEAYASQHGIKIIVPIRPGFGNTTNANSRSDLVETVVGDMLAVLDRHNIQRCPILCMGGDSFFAYHFDNLCSGRVSAILNAAAGFPIFLPRQYERMEKWHRFVLANARYAPKILPFIIKAGFSLAKHIGKRGFLNAIYANSPADTEVIQNPQSLEAMLAGSDISLSESHSAHVAYANEVILKQSEWSQLVRNCKAPIHVWYGDEDPQVPPATMAEIMTAFPHINYHKLENAGQLQLYRHWQAILQCADRYL